MSILNLIFFQGYSDWTNGMAELSPDSRMYRVGRRELWKQLRTEAFADARAQHLLRRWQIATIVLGIADCIIISVFGLCLTFADLELRTGILVLAITVFLLLILCFGMLRCVRIARGNFTRKLDMFCDKLRHIPPERLAKMRELYEYYPSEVYENPDYSAIACGCIECQNIFHVESFSPDTTSLCPRCGSVLAVWDCPDAPLSPESLRALHDLLCEEN